MGKIRHFFPGGNTCQGFYSFYDQILGDEAFRVFIIKGGPGVGKSTFMKKLGEELAELDFNLEYHWCSSDNSSLDAVALPEFRIAVLDGTAPHVVDPKNPGAVDEIVNLGEFWDETLLGNARQEIISLNRLVAQHFRLAYLRLKEARVIWQELAEYHQQMLKQERLFQATAQIKKILESRVGSRSCFRPGRIRHLFISAITPAGVVSKISWLLEPDYTIIALTCPVGEWLQPLFASMLTWSIDKGMDLWCYHHPLEPNFVEMLVWPDVNFAVIDASNQVVDHSRFLSSHPGTHYFDLGTSEDHVSLSRFAIEIEDAEERFSTALEAAVGFISLAKNLHDEMEKYYIQAMDFKAVEKKRRELKSRIMNYIASQNSSS